jgi:hypothetical protein
MASANLDLMRSLYAAWKRGDFSSVEWAHPDIEYVIADGPSPGTSTGLPGLGESWRGILDTWEDFRFEAEEYRELDNERVLVLLRSADAARPADWRSGKCGRREQICFTSAMAR